MRAGLRLVGTLLLGVSALGLVALGAAMLVPERIGAGPSASVAVDLPWSMTPASPRAAATMDQAPPVLASAPIGQPITHIEIPSIDLSADVVEASLVTISGGVTWQVPAFKVGHAESTANAGEVGNAVLLGHVTSVHSGNVFQDLDKVRVGDVVDVFTDGDHFEYQVVSTSAVPRTDTTVLQPTDTPTVSLITCTGIWLPTIWDYTERLVVRAELSQ